MKKKVLELILEKCDKIYKEQDEEEDKKDKKDKKDDKDNIKNTEECQYEQEKINNEAFFATNYLILR